MVGLVAEIASELITLVDPGSLFASMEEVTRLVEKGCRTQRAAISILSSRVSRARNCSCSCLILPSWNRAIGEKKAAG